MLPFTSRNHSRIVRVNVEKLKELRADRALSLRELAAESGVSHTTIWKLEQGREDAHPRTIRLLAGALGVAPRELMAKRGSDVS